MAYQFECTQPNCDFMVRANTEDELVQVVREHADRRHDLTLDRGDVTAGMEETP